MATITLATVCCSVQISAARAMPKKSNDSCNKIGRVARIVLKYQASRPSNFCCLRWQRSCKAPRPKRDVFKYPSHCFPNTPPNAANRLLDRLLYASVWIHIVVELGPVQTGSSCIGNVALSILLINIISSALVVSLAVGLKLDILTMKAELTAENKPA